MQCNARIVQTKDQCLVSGDFDCFIPGRNNSNYANYADTVCQKLILSVHYCHGYITFGDSQTLTDSSEQLLTTT